MPFAAQHWRSTDSCREELRTLTIELRAVTEASVALALATLHGLGCLWLGREPTNLEKVALDAWPFLYAVPRTNPRIDRHRIVG